MDAVARDARRALRVRDERRHPTRRLFVIFYAKLWEDGLGPADALWQAKSALSAEGHPARDWAGWVLSGDPDAG